MLAAMTLSSMRDGPAPAGPFDVAVVGAGAVGCAVARELSSRGARCALIEASADVGAGTSKANTAILHTGFDAKPGSIESRLVARGYELLSEYAGQVGIPNAKLGALMVAWTSEQSEALAGVRAKAAENGHRDTRLVELEELYAREPNIGSGGEGRPGDSGGGPRLPVHGHAGICDRGPRRWLRAHPQRGGHGCASERGGHEIDTARGPVRAAIWSTPPDCAATRSTRCSVTRTSASRRGAGS